MGKGTEGLILKAWRADDYRLRVTSTEDITADYRRIGFSADGLLVDHPVHPTQWIRLWIPETPDGKLRQRGYTLVDQDPEADHFFIEFALHSGPASAWAREAAPGVEIEASVIGSKFRLPDRKPSEYVIFGDTAALPAVNSLLDAIGDTPAQIWLEWQYESDLTLPVRNKPHHQVTWLHRVDEGRGLCEQARDLSCAPDAYGWVACDARTTRSITKTLKTDHGLPRAALTSQGYWK